MAPFYGWGSAASRLEPLRGGSLLFTTKLPEIPGTHFIKLRRMKGWVDLGATQWFFFKYGTPGMGIHHLNQGCFPRLLSILSFYIGKNIL